jgi:tRNA-Thr(GGU) m(6)t(6)A37 methyltransferase TsaA
MSIMSYNVEAIGRLHLASPSKKYQLPRQPDFQDRACIELLPSRNFEQALSGLEGFSHIWVLFWMDKVSGYKPKVRPPGMNQKCGLFSTRSPHRPNPIGLSCVRLIRIQGRRLWIQGCDMLDQTPILDLKPYLSHQESYPEATRGWLEERTKPAVVHCASELHHWLLEKALEDPYLDPKAIIRRLETDPKPSDYNRLKIEEDRFELASGRWRITGRYQKGVDSLEGFYLEKIELAPERLL